MSEENHSSVPTYSINKKYIPFIFLTILLMVIIISSLLLSGVVGSDSHNKMTPISDYFLQHIHLR